MRIGGRLSTEVWSDATVVGLTTLSRHAREGLRLLLEIAARPRFDPADVARVRELRINRIRQLRRSAAAVAERVFAEALYGSHPYGHPAIGTEAALRALGPAEVTDFHRRRYLRPPWTVVAVGDLAPEALQAEGRAGLGRGAPSPAGGAPPGRAAGAAALGPAAGVLRPRGRRAVRDPPRPSRPAAHVARLLRPGRAEHGARRTVREPHQPEPARGEGLHLRGPDVVRLACRARAVLPAGRRADDGHPGRAARGGARDRGRAGPAPAVAARARDGPGGR